MLNVKKHTVLILLVFVSLISFSYPFSFFSGTLTSLNISSSVDYFSEDLYTFERINFFADFKNISSDEPIVGANCSIYFSTEDNLSYGMDFNGSVYNYSKIFYKNLNHEYNITCDARSLGIEEVISLKETDVLILANSRLDVLDTEKLGGYTKGDLNIGFYANYSNISFEPILDASCVINFFDIGISENMSYNSSSKFYEYYGGFDKAGDYSYNISCGSNNNYSNLTVSSSINIKSEFIDSGFNFVNHELSSSLILDSNNNGLMEILVSGINYFSSELYEFDGNNFNLLSDSMVNFESFHFGSIVSSDFNNDGFIDLIFRIMYFYYV